MSDYTIIKKLNNDNLISQKDDKKYFMKKIFLEDMEIYRRLISIDSNNIEKIISIEGMNDELYAVCEFIEGTSLDTYLLNNGCLDYDTAINIIQQISNGLKILHKKGIVHRDINPNNIMITSDNNVKIVDFGISRISKVNKSADTQILGTPGFAAPEQYGFSQTDERADIYSLGVLLNYMLTLRLPNEKLYDGDNKYLITKAIQMDPKKRFVSIEQFESSINKRYSIWKIIRLFPFFKDNVLWKNIIGFVIYPIIILFTIVALLTALDSPTIIEKIYTFIMLISFTIVPFFVIFDFGDFIKRKYLGSSKYLLYLILHKALIITGTILLVIVLFAISQI